MKNAAAGVQRRTMTVEEWIDIKRGFAALDSCQGLGLANLTIAKSLNRIDAALKDYEAGRIKLVNDISGGTNQILPNETEKYRLYTETHAKMLREKVAADIFPLKVEDLKLEQNNVPPSALSALIACGALIEEVATAD